MVGMTGDWAELGRRVKARREAMRLAQAGLGDRAGPGEITVRKIERGEGATVQPRTWVRLEAALRVPDGWVDRILAGTATADDLNTRPARRPPSMNDEPRRHGDRIAVDPDRLWTYSEFAGWAGVPERSARQWIAAGTGPRVIKLGRHRRIRVRDALAWLDSRYVDAT